MLLYFCKVNGRLYRWFFLLLLCLVYTFVLKYKYVQNKKKIWKRTQEIVIVDVCFHILPFLYAWNITRRAIKRPERSKITTHTQILVQVATAAAPQRRLYRRRTIDGFASAGMLFYFIFNSLRCAHSSDSFFSVFRRLQPVFWFASAGRLFRPGIWPSYYVSFAFV